MSCTRRPLRWDNWDDWDNWDNWRCRRVEVCVVGSRSRATGWRRRWRFGSSGWGVRATVEQELDPTRHDNRTAVLRVRATVEQELDPTALQPWAYDSEPRSSRGSTPPRCNLGLMIASHGRAGARPHRGRQPPHRRKHKNRRACHHLYPQRSSGMPHQGRRSVNLT